MSPVRTNAVPVADPQRAVAAVHDSLLSAVERVLTSGRYVHGPEHAAFEEELAAFLGVAHCAGVGSGTDALQLALAGLGLEPGDEVVAAANAGGYATAAARRLGLRVRYADVDPITLGLTGPTVEAAITPATRVVVATHLYGLMCDVEAIVELCRGRGIPVVEDCAQAAGARRNSRRAGTVGDAAAFSFYPTKNLACLGDGGAVVTDREDVAERVRSLRQYGWAERYHVSADRGWNSRLDELQAAVLRLGLQTLDERNERRRAIVLRYVSALRADAGHVVASDGEEFVAHLAVLVCDDRERARSTLARAGVGTAVHYPAADHRQPAWAGEYEGMALPVTEHAVEHVLTVPCFPELTDDEVGRVCEALREL